jgi:alpha-glucosidase
MRKALIAAVALALVAGCAGDDSGSTPHTEVRVDAAGGVTFVVDGRETFSTAGGVPRLRWFDETTNFVVGQWDFRRDPASVVTMDLSEVTAVRESDTGVEVDYAIPSGTASATLLVTHPRPGATSQLRLTVNADPRPDSIALPVRCDAAAGFLGFGAQYNATDQRGEAFRLFVSEQGLGRDPNLAPLPVNGGPHTTYFPMPYFVDPRGFGALVQTAQRVEVDLCKSDPAVAWFEVVDDAPVDVLAFHGPSALDVIDELGTAVGRPASPPDWAYDLWIGAQGGSDVIRAKAAALRAADVPAAVLWVQDWTGVRINFDGGSGVQYRWVSDPTHYPDLAGLIADLRADGFRFLSYANPFVDSRLSDHYPEMLARDLLIRNGDGEAYVFLAPNGLSSLPDLTNPEAREYVKSYLRAMVVDFGMDGWMSDFGEWAPTDAVYADGSDPIARHNLYPIDWHRLWREVMDEVRPDGDYVVFARSGFTGVHAVSMVHWIGDQETDWSTTDGLPTVVPALLNLGLSGIPYVTHDIAGFSGTIAPPSTKELFMRWTELGAFTPIMRTHEGAKKDKNWSWNEDQETLEHFRRFARIHQALGPELRALAAEAARSSAPLLRHLMLVFPDDVRSRAVSDQFMLGDTLLVAPVVTEGATARNVYLPPGTWYHLWSGERLNGGRDIDVDAPLGQPPVFSRDRDRPDLRAIE